jgi:hypothetical protein
MLAALITTAAVSLAAIAAVTNSATRRLSHLSGELAATRGLAADRLAEARDSARQAGRLREDLGAKRQEVRALKAEIDAGDLEITQLRGRLAERGPSLVGKTVVINTCKPDDQTFRGIVHGKYTDRWTLRDACYVAAGGTEQPIPNLHHIPVGNVSSVQEIEG